MPSHWVHAPGSKSVHPHHQNHRSSGNSKSATGVSGKTTAATERMGRGQVAFHIAALAIDDGSNLSHLRTMPAKTISPDVDFKRHLSEAIRARMAQHGLSISQLAERMGTGRAAVRRILDARNTSITFRSINRAAQAVGLKVTLSSEPMSPEELGELAHRLARSKKPAETSKLKAQILKGFYGEV